MGSSTALEGTEYFCHSQKNFIWENEDDEKAIDLAFGKEKSDEERIWIKNFQVWESTKNNLYLERDS